MKGKVVEDKVVEDKVIKVDKIIKPIDEEAMKLKALKLVNQHKKTMEEKLLKIKNIYLLRCSLMIAKDLDKQDIQELIDERLFKLGATFKGEIFEERKKKIKEKFNSRF